jgi:RDD family
LKLRLVDAASGGPLSILQATKRWFILGWPLGLLILVPALQSATSLLQFGLALFLFFTTVTNDQKQGLHDKWSNSLMIRSVTSGDGATVVGCLVWGVLIILFFFVVFSVMFAAAIPIFQEYIRQNPQLT